jgi:hypothetical protein
MKKLSFLFIPYIVFVTRCITIARIGSVRYIRIRVKVVDHLYTLISLFKVFIFYILLINVVNPETGLHQTVRIKLLLGIMDAISVEFYRFKLCAVVKPSSFSLFLPKGLICNSFWLAGSGSSSDNIGSGSTTLTFDHHATVNELKSDFTILDFCLH